MSLTQLTELALHQARVVATSRNRGHRRVIHPWLECYRGADLVAVVRMHGGSHEFLPAAAMSIAGYEADAAILCSDTWVDKRPMDVAHDNPDTGKPWGYGEMTEYGNAHPDGVLREAITLASANRAGDMRMATALYRWDPKARRIKFDPNPMPVVDPKAESLDEEIDISSLIFDHLLMAMNTPSPSAIMSQMGVPPREGFGREQTDSLTALYCDSMYPGFRSAVLVGKTPAERLRMLHELWNEDDEAEGVDQALRKIFGNVTEP